MQHGSTPSTRFYVTLNKPGTYVTLDVLTHLAFAQGLTGVMWLTSSRDTFGRPKQRWVRVSHQLFLERKQHRQRLHKKSQDTRKKSRYAILFFLTDKPASLLVLKREDETGMSGNGHNAMQELVDKYNT